MMKEVYATHPEFQKKKKFVQRAAKNDKVDLSDSGFENMDTEEELHFEADLTPRFHNNTKDIISGFGRSRGTSFQSKPLDQDPEEDGFWSKLSDKDIQKLEDNQVYIYNMQIYQMTAFTIFNVVFYMITSALTFYRT